MKDDMNFKESMECRKIENLSKKLLHLFCRIIVWLCKTVLHSFMLHEFNYVNVYCFVYVVFI